MWTENGELVYRAPKGIILPDDVALLRARKVEIIQAIGNDLPRADALLAPRSAMDVVSLTFQQQWLWNRYQDNADARHVTIKLSMRLSGSLDIEILRAAIDAVCLRHEALRTRIVTVNGVPRQLIEDAYRCDLQVMARHADRTQNALDEVRRLASEFLDEPIDPATGPLFKVRLISLSRRDHVLALAMDHLISDGLSADILLSELFLSYAALARRQPLSLSRAPIQYPDYAVWQRKLHVLWKQQHEEYWRSRLDGATRIQLPIVADTGNAPFSVAGFEIQIGRALTDGLCQLARRESTTLARTMLAVYALLVSILSGNKDFILPFNVMGRHMASLSGTIGYFAHILYLRIQIAAHDTFLDVLRHINAELTAANEHLDFGQMGMLLPQFHLGTRFQWNEHRQQRSTASAVMHGAGAGDLRIKPFQLSGGIGADAKATIDLVLDFSDGPQGIVAIVAYRADLFTADAMDRFSCGMKTLIGEVLQDPDRCHTAGLGG